MIPAFQRGLRYFNRSALVRTQHTQMILLCQLKAGVRTTELAAILFTTFENVQGTVIAYQYPPNYVSSAQFKEIGNVVIPRAELAFHLITVEAFNHYIIGCPQRIEGVQYRRNTLQFNICLVIKPKLSTNLDDLSHWQFWTSQSAGGLRLNVQCAYEALTLKINRHFHALEKECAFLSHALENCQSQLSFLDSIFQQLHESGICMLSFPKCGSLHLRFSPRQDCATMPNNVFDPEELVFDGHIISTNHDFITAQKVDYNNFLQNNQIIFKNYWPPPKIDLTDDLIFVLIAPPNDDNYFAQHNNLLQQSTNLLAPVDWIPLDAVSTRLLKYINGRRSLNALTQLTGFDVETVRLCLVELIKLGIVYPLAAPVFTQQADKCTNSTLVPGWLGLPRLCKLLTDTELGHACLETLIASNSASFNLCLHDVFRLYAIICASANFSLSHFISANPNIHFTDTVDVQDKLATTTSNYSLKLSRVCNCLTESKTNQKCTKISLLHLIQFGELNGLIKRLQHYPISDNLANSNLNAMNIQCDTDTTSCNNSSNCKLTNKKLRWNAMSSIMDGQHSVNTISAILNRDDKNHSHYSIGDLTIPFNESFHDLQDSVDKSQGPSPSIVETKTSSKSLRAPAGLMEIKNTTNHESSLSDLYILWR